MSSREGSLDVSWERDLNLSIHEFLTLAAIEEDGELNVSGWEHDEDDGIFL